ncbi:hypothetical protein [Candidatus Tisiphia endosymbiont of Nemotelus uliginosus]|uniref:hypothetical protein n=1 Tax=Candidatus Tisiphia endosymbiont of Nemotelus uliginosus TaxID=3077926 RepID=UPI0035C8B6BA
MAYEEIKGILEQIKNTERTDKVFNLWDQCRSIVHDNHMPTEVVTSLLRESGIDLTTRLKLLEVKKRDNMISKYNNHWRIRCEYLLEE